MSHSEALAFAIELARRAGAVALERYQSGVDVETKADSTPVTEADRAAERLCRRRIEARFPGDGILGEEYGHTRPDASRHWILDPIDGTKSFVRGVPLFGVLIALEEEGDAVVGVIHFPALDETVAAARGLGCRWNGEPSRVSEVAELDAALLLTTDVRDLRREGHGDAWDRLAARVGMTRTWGDCYGHALVATGRAEAMVDPILAPWDAAPLRVIIEEAGGVFTDWSGEATHRGEQGISTNASLAAAVRSGLGAGAPPR